MTPKYPIRLLSLFSGIGAFEKALERLAIDYELVKYCEIDPYASKAYSLIHKVPESMNLKDVTTVDTSKLHDIDMITYGFPCTDISIAGKMKGFVDEDGNTTRSGLFYEALRIIKDTKPAFAIAENVKNLMSKAFERELDIVLNSLGVAGYNSYIKVLNAKDYGIPQNRERVFIVSIRRDVDDFSFDFPKKETLELRMKDLLEKEVDEKYYMSDKALNSILSPGTKNYDIKLDIEDEKAVIGKPFGCVVRNKGKDFVGTTDIARTLLARDYKGFGNYETNAVAVPVENNINADTEKILIKENTKQGFAEAYEGDSINLEQPNSKTRRGRVGHGVAQTLTTSPQQAVVIKDESEPKIEVGGNYMPSGHDASRVVDTNGLAPTVKENHGTVTAILEEPKKLFNLYPKNGQAGNVYDEDFCAPCLPGFGGGGGGKELKVMHNSRIRKLTPKECFRLMGFDDKDIDILIENGISNTQLYKMAGNSIVVDVLERLFECLLLKKNEEPDLFSMCNAHP